MAANAQEQASRDLIRTSAVPVPWCNEYLKMIGGLTFHAPNAPEMMDHKLKVMKQLNAFNDSTIVDGDTFISLKAKRMAVAKQMFGKSGEGLSIEAPLFCVWGCNVFIGDGCYINRNVQLHDNAPITIGNHVLIGPNVTIVTPTHDTNAVIRNQGGSLARPVTIEDDCWIGANVTILPGVKIGKGSVIASGAVVSKDVPEKVIVGGVPGKVLKTL